MSWKIGIRKYIKAEDTPLTLKRWTNLFSAFWYQYLSNPLMWIQTHSSNHCPVQYSISCSTFLCIYLICLQRHSKQCTLNVVAAQRNRESSHTFWKSVAKPTTSFLLHGRTPCKSTPWIIAWQTSCCTHGVKRAWGRQWPEGSCIPRDLCSSLQALFSVFSWRPETKLVPISLSHN